MEFFDAVKLIADGSVDVLSLVTAQRPLSVAPDAVRLALDRSQSVKVVLTRLIACSFQEIAHDAAGMAVVRAQ